MIYDYSECEKILDNFSNTIIKEVEPIGYSSLEKIPIRRFTLGEGDYHLVVSGSMHSNEIISTTFVLELMKYLIKNNIIFDNICIHFIPILNPEGYIVNTSAIREILPKDVNKQALEKFCLDYYQKYQIDNSSDKENKLHQNIFNSVNYHCIDNKYPILKDSVGEILSNHPKGSIINWASNGNGIDLNSNNILKKVSFNEYNHQKATNNIRIDIPSPIGYPGKNNLPSFKEENEITALKNLFNELNKKNFIGFFNYHSAGGVIFQRPENNNTFLTAYNYLLSKFYQEYSFTGFREYRIITKKYNKVSSVNDLLRLEYPGNLLIEISPFLGNPLSSFVSKDIFDVNINSNIKSFIYTLNHVNIICQEASNICKKPIADENIFKYVDQNYKILKKDNFLK